MKKMAFRILFPALLLGFLCLSAQADTVTYQVTVNTSGQGGNYGYIDLQLNQGTLPPAQPVTATITNFAGGTLNPVDVNNDSIGASGDLATTLTIPADVSTDYFEGLTFGNSISFDITLSGAGVNLAGLAGGCIWNHVCSRVFRFRLQPSFYERWERCNRADQYCERRHCKR